MIKKVYDNLKFNINDTLPTIAVVLATYNGEAYVENQLKSLIEQTLVPDEIIISDDGSTDNTINIITNFKYKYDKNNIIKLVDNEYKGRGHVYNFANACKFVTSDLTFFCDQDDVWIKDKILTMSHIIMKYKLTALHSNEYYTDKNLKIDSYYKFMHKNMKLYNDRNFDDKLLYIFDFEYMAKNRFEPNGCCMVVDSKVLHYLNEYIDRFPILKPFGHDYILFYISGIIGTCGFINQPLIYRRIHGDNVMGKSFTSDETRKISLNPFKREHYLYKFIYYLNELAKIKNYRVLRLYSYLSLHSIKWTIYSFIKNIWRKITKEEERKII